MYLPPSTFHHPSSPIPHPWVLQRWKEFTGLSTTQLLEAIRESETTVGACEDDYLKTRKSNLGESMGVLEARQVAR